MPRQLTCDVLLYLTLIACIDLIERPHNGIIALLVEEGSMPRGNTESLMQKLVNNHQRNAFFGPLHLLIVLPTAHLTGHDQRKKNLFSVNHFAGAVEYTIDEFLVKNKNTLTADAQAVMAESHVRLFLFE